MVLNLCKVLMFLFFKFVYQIPSAVVTKFHASLPFVVNVPGFDVYILTLMASKGHKNVSAIISADPEAMDQPIFLYLTAFSSPTIPL